MQRRAAFPVRLPLRCIDLDRIYPVLSDLSVPLSALQHYAFCPRQCALIHVERLWEENTLTAEGRVMHDRAHAVGSENRRDVRIARALPLQSTVLGIHGVADVVEFHRRPDSAGANEVWQPFPVEYKRGRPKHEPIDAVQLCAQALCLEEMLAVAIPAGAIFYGQTHRRHDLVFDAPLREQTRELITATRQLIESGTTPPPEYARRCESCSLKNLCQPCAATRSASTYLTRLIAS